MGWLGLEHTDYVEHVTEDAVALRMAEREAGRLRFCHDADAWFAWDEVAWRRDRTGLARQRAREVAREVGLDPFGKARAAPGSLRFVIGVERLARGDPALAVTTADWDAAPFLLGTPGGTVRLRTGELAAADPQDGIRRTTAVIPAATADCPLWTRVFEEATGGDAELGRFLHCALGSVLTGAPGECPLLFGQDRSGTSASVLMANVVALLGDYARPATPASLASGNPDALRGVRLIVAQETDAGRPWPDAALRRFADASGEAARLIVVGLAPPVLHHLGEAMRRHVCVLPFRRRAAPDRDLEAGLAAERPAILRWLIEGCLDWQANGLVRPSCAIEATTRAFKANDVLGQFLEDKCVCGPGDRDKSAMAGALFAEWSAYAEAAGERPGSPRTFAEALQARGFTRDRLMSGRIFRGLDLRSAPPPGERYALRCGLSAHDSMTA